MKPEKKSHETPPEIEIAFPSMALAFAKCIYQGPKREKDIMCNVKGAGCIHRST